MTKTNGIVTFNDFWACEFCGEEKEDTFACNECGREVCESCRCCPESEDISANWHLR